MFSVLCVRLQEKKENEKNTTAPTRKFKRAEKKEKRKKTTADIKEMILVIAFGALLKTAHSVH